MEIPSWLLILLICVMAAFGVIFLAWQIGQIVDDLFSANREKRFKEDVQLAIENSQPSWQQVLAIADSRNIRPSQLCRVLQHLLRETLTGRNSEIESHLSLIESYLTKFKEAEPFDGIPNEIRVNLERIKEQSPSTSPLLQPLTEKIKDLLAVNQKSHYTQNYLNVASIVVGLGGLVFGAFNQFSTHPTNLPNAATSVTKTTNPSPASEGTAELKH